MSYKIIGKYIKGLDFGIPNAKIFSLLSKNISNYKINIDIKNTPEPSKKRGFGIYKPVTFMPA